MIFMMNPALFLESLPAMLWRCREIKALHLCCGAGGAQMFKEAEKGDKEIFIERTEDALKD